MDVISFGQESVRHLVAPLDLTVFQRGLDQRADVRAHGRVFEQSRDSQSAVEISIEVDGGSDNFLGCVHRAFLMAHDCHVHSGASGGLSVDACETQPKGQDGTVAVSQTRSVVRLAAYFL